MNVFKDNPNWKAKEKIDKVKGFVGYEYYYKNNKCHKVKLDSVKIRNFKGYLLIHRDIRNIDTWLNLLNKHLYELYGDKIPLPNIRIKEKENVYDTIKSLFISSVTMYGKLFVKAEGRLVKLEKQIFGNNSELLGYHETIMKYRHNFTAHSGATKTEGVIVYLLIDSIKDRDTLPIIVKEIYQPDYPAHEEIINFQKLIQFLKEKVDRKTDKLFARIYQSILER